MAKKGRNQPTSKTRRPTPHRTSNPPPANVPPPEPRSEPTPHRWTFLTNHSHVLIVLSRDPTMVLREVAARVGITERAVQRIIADLEDEAIIERSKLGRRNHYRILSDRALRHPIESHRTVGDLLRAIDGPG